MKWKWNKMLRASLAKVTQSSNCNGVSDTPRTQRKLTSARAVLILLAIGENHSTELSQIHLSSQSKPIQELKFGY